MKLNLNDPEIVSEMKAGTATVTTYQSGNVVIRDDALGTLNINFSTGDILMYEHNGVEYKLFAIFTHDGISVEVS